MTPSGFLHSENSISPLDITILLVFIIARVCDISLVVAAIKQKSDWDKTPLLVLPWLIINALEMTLKVVSFIAKLEKLEFSFSAHLILYFQTRIIYQFVLDHYHDVIILRIPTRQDGYICLHFNISLYWCFNGSPHFLLLNHLSIP